MSSNNLGVWTDQDCALILIDYQKEMFDSIRSETSADLVELHARLLPKMATAFDVPIVLSTVGVGAGFNRPTRPSILAELPAPASVAIAPESRWVSGAIPWSLRRSARTPSG